MAYSKSTSKYNKRPKNINKKRFIYRTSNEKLIWERLYCKKNVRDAKLLTILTKKTSEYVICVKIRLDNGFTYRNRCSYPYDWDNGSAYKIFN